jgi:hypothetical protein
MLLKNRKKNTTLNISNSLYFQILNVKKEFSNTKIPPKKINPHYDTFRGELRVLACADTGARTPLGMRQYSKHFWKWVAL